MSDMNQNPNKPSQAEGEDPDMTMGEQPEIPGRPSQAEGDMDQDTGYTGGETTAGEGFAGGDAEMRGGDDAQFGEAAQTDGWVMDDEQ